MKVTWLTRYQTVWKKYFKSYDALSCCNSDDRTHDKLCEEQRIYLFLHLLNFVVRCVTSKLDRYEVKAMADAITKIGKVFQEKVTADVNIFLISVLPQHLHNSKWINKTWKEIIT